MPGDMALDQLFEEIEPVALRLVEKKAEATRRANGEPIKLCRKCLAWKPIGQFYDRTKIPGERYTGDSYGKTSKCKECSKKKTREYWARTSKAQMANCPLCGHWRKMVQDHCHTTGKDRELLCNPCNMALGQFDDCPATLRRAAEYLERYRRLYG